MFFKTIGVLFYISAAATLLLAILLVVIVYAMNDVTQFTSQVAWWYTGGSAISLALGVVTIELDRRKN